MKTMEDVILEYSDKNISTTGEVLKLLELPINRETIGAANLFWAALKIIKKLRNEKK